MKTEIKNKQTNKKPQPTLKINVQKKLTVQEDNYATSCEKKNIRNTYLSSLDYF